MAVQAGRDPLDYSLWDSDKASYFSAIQNLTLDRRSGEAGKGGGTRLDLAALQATQPPHCRRVACPRKRWRLTPAGGAIRGVERRQATRLRNCQDQETADTGLWGSSRLRFIGFESALRRNAQ